MLVVKIIKMNTKNAKKKENYNDNSIDILNNWCKKKNSLVDLTIDYNHVLVLILLKQHKVPFFDLFD